MIPPKTKAATVADRGKGTAVEQPKSPSPARCRADSCKMGHVERASARPGKSRVHLHACPRSAVLVVQVQEARLLVAVGGGPLRHGTAVIAQLEQGELAQPGCGLRFDLRPAQF